MSNYGSVNVIMVTLLLFCPSHIKYIGVKDLDFGLVWLVVFSFCFYLVEALSLALLLILSVFRAKLERSP